MTGWLWCCTCVTPVCVYGEYVEYSSDGNTLPLYALDEQSRSLLRIGENIYASRPKAVDVDSGPPLLRLQCFFGPRPRPCAFENGLQLGRKIVGKGRADHAASQRERDGAL